MECIPVSYTHLLEDECYKLYNERFEVENLIDDILFSKYLKNNYFTPIEDLKGIDSIFKKNIVKALSLIHI